MRVFRLSDPEVEGAGDEEVQVYGRADLVRVEASRDGHACGRGDPEDGGLGADVLTLESKYGSLGVGELMRLKQLEDESRKLKQLVADLQSG
ncbi:hypothetical protein GCM10008170_25780 [Methylopila capsulata]|uniref:Uncharacterized protein n=1 Tax=Methylopila capsulata TaxID=61654 RepID=A0A9W6IWH8_9HYPH|nr:hypothetical protein GCM10008170_25780 [Methylopila capsulata]